MRFVLRKLAMDIREKFFVSLLLVLWFTDKVYCFNHILGPDPIQHSITTNSSSPKVEKEPRDMKALKEKYQHQICALNNQFLTDVANRLDAAEQKHLDSKCRENFISSMKKTVDPRLAKITACYDDNVQNKQYVVADLCYKRNIAALGREEEKLHEAIKGCIYISCTATFTMKECDKL